MGWTHVKSTVIRIGANGSLSQVDYDLDSLNDWGSDMEQTHTRTTRQASVGRFRATRLSRRADDLAERQSAILKAAERVVEIVGEVDQALADTREFVEATTTDRKAWGDRLRSELAQFDLDLSNGTKARLAELLARRRERAKSDHADRQAFMNGLRAEVVRIVSEDFA